MDQPTEGAGIRTGEEVDVAHQTETPMLATLRAARPYQHLVSTFLDDDLDRRLTALSPTRSLAGGPQFRAVVNGLVAVLGSANPTHANRTLTALTSLGPPVIPPAPRPPRGRRE